VQCNAVRVQRLSTSLSKESDDHISRTNGPRLTLYLIIIIIIIIYLSWSWTTCWPVPVSRIQKSLQMSAMIPSSFLPWVIYYGAFYLHVVSISSCLSGFFPWDLPVVKISPECVTGPEQGKSSGRIATFSLWTGVFRDGISSIPDETVIPLWLGRYFLVCENKVYHCILGPYSRLKHVCRSLLILSREMQCKNLNLGTVKSRKSQMQCEVCKIK